MASLCRRAVPSIPFMTRLVCRGLQVSSVPSGAQPQPKQDEEGMVAFLINMHPEKELHNQLND